MNKEQPKKGGFERFSAALEGIHYGIGAIALLGASLLPEFTAPLVVFGALEIAHGALLNWIKNRASKKPNLSPAPA